MTYRAPMLVRCTALAAVLALAACNQQQQPTGGELNNLDNQIAGNETSVTGNEADPALTSALEDQIATDPTLQQQSNNNAVRSPQGPVQAQYPVNGQGKAGTAPVASRGAAVRTAGGGTQALQNAQSAACSGEFDYNMGWARKLPAEFPVFPGGRVTDAAASKGSNCRVVTFTSDVAPQQVIDWYGQRASSAGYSVEHDRRQGDHILAGASNQGSSAYYIIVTPMRRGGSDVSLIINKGG